MFPHRLAEHAFDIRICLARQQKRGVRAVQAFNRGDYQESVEAKRKADAIVSVLYPNDATPEGKLLRLEQQYFFVSASIQVLPPPSLSTALQNFSSQGPLPSPFPGKHGCRTLARRSICTAPWKFLIMCHVGGYKGKVATAALHAGRARALCGEARHELGAAA